MRSRLPSKPRSNVNPASPAGRAARQDASRPRVVVAQCATLRSFVTGCYEGWTRVICISINRDQKTDKAMVVPQTRERPVSMSALVSGDFSSRLGWQIA
jgi:hypothetical protein